MRILTIVPCSKRKIWDDNPKQGPTAAKFAYTSSCFKVNSKYASCISSRWYILSAKYGFICPEFVIPKSYDVAFSNKTRLHAISASCLAEQVKNLKLYDFDRLIGLGGVTYREVISIAFANYDIEIAYPFVGYSSIGKYLQAVKSATTSMKGFGIW